MARIAKIDDVSIPVFDGAEYSSWKFRFLNILEYKDCLIPAKRERGDADSEEIYKKKDLQAKTYLIGAISNKQLEFIKNETSVFQMLKVLDKMYLNKSTGMQMLLKPKIEEIKLINYENIEDFFADFEKFCNEYIQAGGTITEEEKLRYMIKAIPSSYALVGQFLD